MPLNGSPEFFIILRLVTSGLYMTIFIILSSNLTFILDNINVVIFNS